MKVVQAGVRLVASSVLVCALSLSATGLAGAAPVPQQSAAANAPLAATQPITPPATVADQAAGYAISAFNALQAKDAATYATAIQNLALSLSPRVNVSASALVTAWNGGTPSGMTAMLAGLTQIGVGYGFATDTPWVSFDCSGLASWAWSLAGVSLPHQSLLIINQVTPSTLAQVKPGDILYYPGHVMIALGVGDAMVHAANAQIGVEASSLNGREASVLQVGSPTNSTAQTGVTVPAPKPDTWITALAKEKRVLTPKAPAITGR